jgi:hypothetical protein
MELEAIAHLLEENELSFAKYLGVQMPLPPRLSRDHVDGLFAAGAKPEDVVMPCERCGTKPARKVNLVGEEKRLCSSCNKSYYSSNWEIWAG